MHFLAKSAVQKGYKKFCGQSGARWRREGGHCPRAAGVGRPYKRSLMVHVLIVTLSVSHVFSKLWEVVVVQCAVQAAYVLG